MKKEVIVISLGGSLIIPNDIDVNYLKKFKIIIKKHSKSYKFVIVTGGGSIARKYISALREINLDYHMQGLAGISATRMNARFMSYFFGFEPEYGASHSLKEIKQQLNKKGLVFSGALSYKKGQTTDSEAALLAKYFKSKFINLTNVNGLYNKDPRKYKDAKFTPKISWKEFHKIANLMSFKPGQHFILDQKSSKIIMKYKIPTYIIGKNTNELDNLLKKDKFKGTIIEG